MTLAELKASGALLNPEAQAHWTPPPAPPAAAPPAAAPAPPAPSSDTTASLPELPTATSPLPPARPLSAAPLSALPPPPDYQTTFANTMCAPAVFAPTAPGLGLQTQHCRGDASLLYPCYTPAVPPLYPAGDSLHVHLF